MKKIILLTALSIYFLSVVDQPEEARQIISIYPQYILIKGMKVGWEKPLDEKRWLILSPELYYSENVHGWNYDYQSLWGSEISLHQPSQQNMFNIHIPWRVR